MSTSHDIAIGALESGLTREAASERWRWALACNFVSPKEFTSYEQYDDSFPSFALNDPARNYPLFVPEHEAPLF